MREAGFKSTTCTFPEMYDSKDSRWFDKEDSGDILGCDVICNQDGVIYFLLTNKIPFIATIHSNDSTYVWDGKSDNIEVLPNLGIMFGFQLYVCGLRSKPESRGRINSLRAHYTGPDRINVEEYIREEQHRYKD